MALLTGAAFENAVAQSRVAILPIATDPAAALLAGSTRFGPFSPGDQIMISSTAAFHVVAGDSAVVASPAADPVFPAGVYKMAIPDGCTHVAMIDSAAGAGLGQAYKG